MRAVREFLAVHPSVEKVIFVLHGDDTYRVYRTILEKDRKDHPETLMTEAILAHLLMIETTHGIRIRNREEIVQTIGPLVKNDTQALSFGMEINTWVAVSGVTGEVTVPDQVINRMLEQIKKV